MSRQVVD